MNRKIIKIIVVLSLSLVLLFAFTACSSDNQDLLNRLDDLEKKFETSELALNAKISALESANALYKTQLDYLTASHTSDLKTLNSKIVALESASNLYKTQLDALIDTHSADITMLTTKISALETANALFQTQIVNLDTDIETMSAKMSALETANALFQTQIVNLDTDIETMSAKISALETANATFATEISALTARDTELETSITDLQSSLDALTASVADAAKVERVVIKPSDVGNAHPIAKSVYIDINLPEPSERLQSVKIECVLGHGDYSFNYQLITFNTSLLINDTLHETYNIAVTQAKSGEHLITHTFDTKIPYDSSSSDTYTVTWSEIILYRFI